VIADDERRRVRGDAVLPLVDRRLPDDLAVGSVESLELGIEPHRVDEVVLQRQSAMDRAAAEHGVEALFIFGLVAPHDIARLGVDGEHAPIVGREVEHAIMEQRRGLEAAGPPVDIAQAGVSLAALSGVISASGL
jgi:hypothetical protein